MNTLDKLKQVTFHNKVVVEQHGVVFSVPVRSARSLRMHDIEYGKRKTGRTFRALDLKSGFMLGVARWDLASADHKSDMR